MKRHEIDTLSRRVLEGDADAVPALVSQLESAAQRSVHAVADELQALADLLDVEAREASTRMATLQAHLAIDLEVEVAAAITQRVELWVCYLAALHAIARELSPRAWRVPELIREASKLAATLGRDARVWVMAEDSWLDGRAALIIGLARRADP
jgi:hypothetical protein